MNTPTNIPETPMGGTEQDSYFKSKEKFQQQLQHIFQTTLRLNDPDQFDQLCQWMEYNQYLTIDDFYHSSYNDPRKFDIEGPATEYKWKGKVNHLSANVAQKLKSFVRWMAHEDRPYELHDDFLATLTRESYLKFRHLYTQSLPTLSPSHHEPYKHQVKKRPQRKAFLSQQEEANDEDEYGMEEEQFSTDPEPEEPSPYSVYQSSFHPKMPQEFYLPPKIWETLSESTKQMIIEHNKKVKLNNPTPYLSGSKTKPNPTLGKPTPAPQQVHQHSQDEPCDDLDLTDTPSSVPTALQAPSDDTSNPKRTHSLVETQCNHSQYLILMKKICTHDPPTNQVGKSYKPHPVPFPYPPDPGEHVLETSSAPPTLVERNKLDLSSLIPPKGR